MQHTVPPNKDLGRGVYGLPQTEMTALFVQKERLAPS